MGSYLNVPLKRDKGITTLHLCKKIKLENCLFAFKDYYKNHFPKKELDEEEFNDIFSATINNTSVVFGKL